MPELPDIEVYLHALRQRILGQTLLRVELRNPFVLRTVMPPVQSVEGRPVRSLARVGKRIVIGFDDAIYLVIHLMIAGRLQWIDTAKKSRPRGALLELGFADGVLVLTEAGTKRRASLHVIQGEASLNAMNPGGIEPLEMDRDAFRSRIGLENHTLKRALTDPHLFSGIGNAYSDEILHRAKLSPMALTKDLSPADADRLFDAIQATLREWTQRLLAATGTGFPEKVTAFHDQMAAHGRFGKPCPVCGSPIQRIVYAENETNYCARCQTGGKLLADRALSRLLKKTWPRRIDDL